MPGIDRLTATALAATIGHAKTFRSGREFASFLGLVPRQSGTGGKIQWGSISRRIGSAFPTKRGSDDRDLHTNHSPHVCAIAGDFLKPLDSKHNRLGQVPGCYT